jgi:hypothetical protein
MDILRRKERRKENLGGCDYDMDIVGVPSNLGIK